MNRPLNRSVKISLTALPLVTAAVILVFMTMSDASIAWKYAAVLPVAYLLGSIPWGYLILHLCRGVDIREYGSGRTGMSNVLRTAGGRIAGLVLLLDLSKGMLAVLIAREVIGTNVSEVAVGLIVLIGHNWPVFLGFRGGRGIATGLGSLSVMVPIAAIIGAVAFIPITLLSRYLSLGSIIGVVIACLSVVGLALLGLYSTTYTVYALVAAAIIIWQHRDNIYGILHGTERRLGHPAAKL
ncbi:MAG: glycerol-3-phosphate 1-O-acyltransferase PlsY [Dehalococcoidia bacterium]